MEAKKSSRALDALLFLVTLVIMILMLMYTPAFFWVPLPFVLTYLVRAFDAI